MADQSFDSTQASSNDKLYMQDGYGQYPQGQAYGNPYPESASTPLQASIDQRALSGGNNIMGQGGATNAKIDGDQMPRPLKLLNSYSVRQCIPERFLTKSLESLPQAGVPFIQVDEGQTGPKFMRCTVSQAPIEQIFQTQSNVPFGFCVQPLAEMTQFDYQFEMPDVPLIDHGDEGPFRCHRCKAYVNPYMQFIEGGMKAVCNLCTYPNDVPVNYQSQINEFGQRRDKLQRPELQYGTYEFIAPAVYQTRPALNPTFVFVIDVSQFSQPLGVFQQVVQSIKMTLDYFQNPENTTVCFVTYDINIHFYNLPKDPNGEPSIVWVGEVQDPFIPFPKEKLMLKLVEDRERIDVFLDKLVNMHQIETKKYQQPFLCTGAAISAAKQLLHDNGGRILVFSSGMCTTGFGTTTCRDDPKQYNTDKEKAILQPGNDIYIKMAEECVSHRICVDIFYCLNSPAKSIDFTSVAVLAAHTGGDLYYYNPFEVAKHGERLHYEIFRVLTRTQGSEVAIKARTSTGFSVIEYFGGFGVKESVDFDLAAIDSDKFIGFLIRCDEKQKEDAICHVQFAMMYTTLFGQKRIRVFNQCFTMAKNLNAYYKSADCEGLSTFTVKREVSRIMIRGAKGSKETIINNLVSLLHVYRQKCAAQTSPSQLILPDNLKLLPLYTLTTLKTPALKMFPGVKVDEKIYWMYKILRLAISHMPYFFYPRIYKVTDVGTQECSFGEYREGSQFMSKPQCVPAAMERLGSKDAYIIDNGEYIFLYLGNQVDDAFIQNVFGYTNFSDLKFSGVTTFAPVEGYEASNTLWTFIEQIRYEKSGGVYQPLRLVYAGDAQEKELIESCLVEDSVDINKDFPYTDFLCMLHKLIRNKISQ